MQTGHVKLTKDEANQIASNLCDQIDSSNNGKESVNERWKMVESIYRCDSRTSNLHIVDGLDPYIFPMYRQKATKIGRTVLSAYFGLKPWVQMIDITKTPDNPVQSEMMPEEPVSAPVASVERTFQAWIESSNLKNSMQTVFMNMVHFNCGVVQVYTKEDGTLCSRAIHPDKTVFYPCQSSDYKSRLTLGHEYTPLRYQIEEDLENDKYNKDWVDVSKIGIAPNNVTKTTTDRVMAHDSPVMSDRADEPIECYELITKLKLKGDKKREWYLACVEYQGRQLLSLDRYPYSTPWYFVYKTSYDEDNMYPSDSVGGVMQGIQLAYNDILTTILHGSYMSAFPMTVISGGSLSNKVGSYQAGQLIESAEEIKVQSVVTQFNPGALPNVAQKFEELADGVSGVSRLGTVEALPGHTTATAAHGFLAAQQESKDEYVEGVSSPFKDMSEFMFEMMLTHAPKVQYSMGKKWQIPQGIQIDPTAIDLQPTGGGATTDPQLLGQKLVTLQQMAENPASSLDPGKVETKMIEAMDLPFDTDTLKKPPPNPNAPAPPIMQPNMSISVKFEDLGNPDLSPMQLDALEQAGFHVPPPPSSAPEQNGMMNPNGTGQPDMGEILQKLGMVGGQQTSPAGTNEPSQETPNFTDGGQNG